MRRLRAGEEAIERDRCRVFDGIGFKNTRLPEMGKSEHPA
jgi:hypothetical protein